jgi:cell division inhibitor SepF
MVKALRKVTNYLGLTEDDLMNSAEMNSTAHAETPIVRRPAMTPRVSQSVAPVTTPRLTVAQPVMETEPMVAQTLDRIVTLHPRFYSEARTIGEHFRMGSPVIMNLSDMEESERKRLVDFASGLVFGHAGTIERVTPKVFLLSPPNVAVSTEMKAAAADASFFNQS